MPQATIIDLTPKERGVEGGAVEDPLRYALCVEELVICDNRRKSAVKYFLFFRSPVVSVPAFAAYCHLPTVFLSGVADS